MMKLLLTLLAAQCVSLAAGAGGEAGSAAISGKCKQANDFEKTECGKKDVDLTCCDHKQVCIGPIKPLKGKDKHVCSQARKLAGAKVMKVVLIPMIFMILDIVFIVIMVLKCDIKGSHTTKMCIGAIATSWPILLSKYWFLGVWASFLSLFVAYMSATDGLPRWIYRIVWILQIFQVVLIFGPNETFHVPLFQQSLAGKNSDLLNDFLKYKEADCNTFYENFFKFVAIEKEQKAFNPDLEYFGLCVEGFIGLIQAMIIFQGLVWIVTIFVSAKTFLTDGVRSSTPIVPAKVEASPPPPTETPSESQPLRDTADAKEAPLVVEPATESPASAAVEEVPPAAEKA